MRLGSIAPVRWAARLLAIFIIASLATPLAAVCYPGSPAAMPCCVKQAAGAPPAIRPCCGTPPSTPTTTPSALAGVTVGAPAVMVSLGHVASAPRSAREASLPRLVTADIRLLNSVFLI